MQRGTSYERSARAETLDLYSARPKDHFFRPIPSPKFTFKYVTSTRLLLQPESLVSAQLNRNKYLSSRMVINTVNIQPQAASTAHLPPLWLFRPWKDLGRLTHGRFLSLFRHPVGIHWTSNRPVAKASTCTERKTRTDIHALSGIRTPSLIVQATQTYALHRAATGSGCLWTYFISNDVSKYS
jgi:hypothetical protein